MTADRPDEPLGLSFVSPLMTSMPDNGGSIAQRWRDGWRNPSEEQGLHHRAEIEKRWPIIRAANIKVE
ncbi:MAG TPA: hypothetical protein VEM36_13990 [Xanthobacteraceae bacterium]|nr:hypothetical protein [Xanthobacteraceae bacterium]